MPKFAIVDSDGTMDDDRYNTMQEAVDAACKEASENAEAEVEVIQILKTVSSTLKIDVEDVI